MELKTTFFLLTVSLLLCRVWRISNCPYAIKWCCTLLYRLEMAVCNTNYETPIVILWAKYSVHCYSKTGGICTSYWTIKVY